MTTIHIEASSSYDVTVERGILRRIGEESARLFRPGKAVIVSGERVFALYGDAAADSLRRSGFEVLSFTHENSEEAKSLAVYGELLRFLSENRVSRTDVLFALGGGVTGDLTGFAAATYQRGIPFVQIPTTLLAAVDSSVGGKTAVNLPSAKNQVGCFYQPRAVFCDPDVLKTLPEREYRCGCAEVIKCGVLVGGALFDALAETNIRQQEEYMISECVKMKRDLVQADEFDTGARRLLNLGHTIGHAVEQCSDFRISHGEAVAIGLAKILRAAAKRGICNEADRDRVIGILEKYGLPTECGFSADELAEACMADKKIAGGRLHLVVPEAIGRCRIIPVERNEIRSWIE